MVGDVMTNVALQITRKLYIDGVQKNFYFFSYSYLTLYLALKSSRVLKASFALAGAMVGGAAKVVVEIAPVWKR